MWANTAAESLLGQSESDGANADGADADQNGASGEANGASDEAGGAHALHLMDTSQSKPPPGLAALAVGDIAAIATTAADGADDVEIAEPAAPGPVKRFFAKVRALFRRNPDR